MLWAGATTAFLLAIAFVIRTAVANHTTDLTAVWGTFWDFRDGTYYAVKSALDGNVPWDVSAYMAEYPVGQAFRVNPPTYLVAHAPFALFGYSAASIAMFVVNLVAMVLFTRWSLKLARFSPTPLVVLWLSSLVIISTAGRNVLFSGQSAILFSAGAYLAFTATTERTRTGGVFVSLIKPTFGLPVTLFTAATGRLRSAITGAGVAAAISAVLMIPFVFWAGGLRPLFDILIDNMNSAGDSTGISLETSTGRVDVPIVIARLFDVVPPATVENILIVVVIGGTAALLYRRRSLFSHGTYNDAAVVLACLAVVTGMYHSVYDMIILVLPTFLLLRPDFAGGQVLARIRYGALGALLVAGFNPFKIDTIADMFTDSQRLIGILGPGLTGLALLVALVLSGLMVWQLPASPGSVAANERDTLVEVGT